MEEKIIGPVVAAGAAALNQCLPVEGVGNELSKCATTIRDATISASNNAAKTTRNCARKAAKSAYNTLMLRDTRNVLGAVKDIIDLSKNK